MCPLLALLPLEQELWLELWLELELEPLEEEPVLAAAQSKNLPRAVAGLGQVALVVANAPG